MEMRVATSGHAPRRSPAWIARLATLACGVLLWLGAPAVTGVASASTLSEPQGIHKIAHVVMIVQENHSFDNYFGTYPGANGIPAGVCLPDPKHGGCVSPFHNPSLESIG